MTYCTGNAIILAAACINVVLLIILLVWHLGEQSTQSKCTDKKTLTLILMATVEALVFFNYLFTKSDVVGDTFVLVIFNLTSMCYLAILYYFIEGAIVLLDESESILKFIRVFTICVIIAIVGTIIYEIYFVFIKLNNELCTSWFFIPPDVLNLIINIVFVT